MRKPVRYRTPCRKTPCEVELFSISDFNALQVTRMPHMHVGLPHPRTHRIQTISLRKLALMISSEQVVAQ